jgi:hypothetical protein
VVVVVQFSVFCVQLFLLTEYSKYVVILNACKQYQYQFIVRSNNSSQLISLCNVSIGIAEHVYTVECVGGHAGIPLHWECVARVPLNHILSMLAHAPEHILCHLSALRRHYAKGNAMNRLVGANDVHGDVRRL